MRRIYISNKRKTAPGSARFIKVDATNPCITLCGAVFELYVLNRKRCRYEKLSSGHVTGEDGVLVIDDLEPGEYMLAERKAPAGYLFQNTKVFFCIGLSDSGEIIEPEPIKILNYPGEDCCCLCYCKCCCHCCSYCC